MTTSIGPSFKFNPEVGKKEIVSVFDTIMSTVKKHLQEEYDAQRIKGAEYSKVYLGSMEAVLGNTVQYLVGMALTDEQRADITAGIKQKEAQIRQINYITDTQLPAQVKLTIEQAEGAKYQRLNIMPAEKDKIVADKSLVIEQLEGAKYQRLHIMPVEKSEITSRTSLNNAQTNLVSAQKTKTNSEHLLIDEKKRTEIQQQKVAMANRSVLLRQSKGYEIDFRIKTTKIIADIYSAGLVAAGNEAGFGYTTVTNRLSDIDGIVSQSDPLPAA